MPQKCWLMLHGSTLPIYFSLKQERAESNKAATILKACSNSRNLSSIYYVPGVVIGVYFLFPPRTSQEAYTVRPVSLIKLNNWCKLALLQIRVEGSNLVLLNGKGYILSLRTGCLPIKVQIICSSSIYFIDIY